MEVKIKVTEITKKFSCFVDNDIVINIQTDETMTCMNGI